MSQHRLGWLTVIMETREGMRMDASEHPAAAPRHTWVFATAFLGLALPVTVGIAAYWAGPAAGAVAAAAFGLPLLYALPGGRALWARHRTWLLTAQALLTYLPYVWFGGDWIVGLPGLLGGLLLLTVAAPASWLLASSALAAEVLLRFAVVGLPEISGLSETTLVLVVPVYAGMALFGLVRLADLVTELDAARTELARLTVARERLRAAERLRTAIGDRLDTVTARARAALAVLARAPDEARAQLDEAAGLARQALEQVRAMVAGDRRVPGQDASVGQGGGAEPTLAPRLARLVLVVVLVAFSVQLAIDAITGRSHPAGHAGHPADQAAGWVAAVSVAAIVALAALQLYHSTAWRERARPRGWAWTLGAQLVLTGFGFIPALHPSIHGLSGFVAGSALLLLPRRWGWIAFAGIQAAIAAHVIILPGRDAVDFAYAVLLTATTGLVVYGLSRLTGLAVALDETRRELARMAVVRERLRVARDTHDLLGMGLSAVALKSDLARRLIGRDDARAGTELAALVRLAGQARAEVLAVTAGAPRLSLRAELDAAADVLASAGVIAAIHAEPPEVPLPEQVDAVLATLLREAVTNVLRHAKARRCEIALTVDEDAARLQVTNDGVPQPAPQRRQGGHGLANLSARAVTLGGRVSTHAEGGRFVLAVRVPLLAASARPAGDPAHGVDEVLGGTVLDQET